MLNASLDPAYGTALGPRDGSGRESALWTCQVPRDWSSAHQAAEHGHVTQYICSSWRIAWSVLDMQVGVRAAVAR